MRDKTLSWGIEIVRTELKEIDPPRDVQEAVNKVVKGENKKAAALLEHGPGTERRGWWRGFIRQSPSESTRLDCDSP